MEKKKKKEEKIKIRKLETELAAKVKKATKKQ